MHMLQSLDLTFTILFIKMHIVIIYMLFTIQNLKINFGFIKFKMKISISFNTTQFFL